MSQSPSPPYPSSVRLAALALTFLTGACGLIYEVVWHRYLTNFVGSQARAAAIILAIFLAGLSAGYALFGRLSRAASPARLVRITGLIEIGIGAWAICFPTLYGWAWTRFGVLDPGGAFALASELAICALLMGVPTILMGGTLPLLTQALSRDLADSAPLHAAVYASNTGGAFLGCLLAGLVLVPSFGLPLTMLGAAPFNILAGIGLLGAARLLPAGAVEERVAQQAARQPLLAASSIAFLCGFLSLTLQILLMRLFGFSVGASEYAFALIVSIFICMLALGASGLAKPGYGRSGLGTNQLLVAAGLVLLHLSVPEWPHKAYLLRSLFSDSPASFWFYLATLFLAFGAVVGIPIAFMGRSMPLLFASISDDVSKLGRYVGRLYAWNTAGCAVGAIAGGYLLLIWVDLEEISLICICVAFVTAALSLRKRPAAGLACLVTGALIWAILPAWPRERFAMGTFRAPGDLAGVSGSSTGFYRRFMAGMKVLAYDDDPNTSVAVMEITSRMAPPANIPYLRSIYVNGKSDGSTASNDLLTTRLLGHLPALLHGAQSGRAAVIGFGTGITAGSLTLHEEITSIDTIEISPAVKSFAVHFSEVNHGAATHPKLRWQLDDAYRVLGAADSPYAIIVSEPSNPWVGGVERLYATDFYEIVKRNLAPRGIYAQWFHAYSVSPDTLAMVVNTFATSFPHTRIFSNKLDLILLGSLAPFGSGSIEAARSRLSRPAVAAELAELGLDSIESVLALEEWLPASAFEHGALHSLDFPKLAFAAGRDFFLNETAHLGTLEERLHEWSSRYGAHTLFAQSGALSSLEGAWQVILRGGCARYGAALERADPNVPYHCRAAFLGEAVSGRREYELRSLDPRVEMARFLLKGGSSIVLDESALDLALTLFESMRSDLLPFSVDALRGLAESCIERDPACRARYARVLARTGFLSQAERELSQVDLASLAPMERATIKAAFESARRAELRLAQQAKWNRLGDVPAP